jgi:hypothetical protein
MALELFENNPITSVTVGGSSTPAPGTNENWTVSTPGNFPTADSGATPPTQFHIVDPTAPSEIMAVINVSGSTWTVTRGAEGTTPVTHAAGFDVEQIVSAGAFTSFISSSTTLGGDLSGFLPSPTVKNINGVTVTGTPAAGMALQATTATAASWQALPDATTSQLGVAQFDGTASDIEPLATSPSAGSNGKIADSGHVHPTTGLVTTATTAGGDASGEFSALVVTKTNGVALGTSATKNLNTVATNSEALGTQAVGASGVVADAAHVHPVTGLMTTSTPMAVNGSAAASGLVLTASSASAAAWVAALQRSTTASDIAALGTQAAGSVGTAADAGHVHPTTGLVTTANPMAISGTASSGLVLTASSASAAAWVATLARNTTAGDIAALGTQSAGSVGTVADAGHVHPTTGLITTNEPIASSGAPTSGQVLTAVSTTAAEWLTPLQTNTSAGEIQALGTAAEPGSSGLAADAAHVHPTTGILSAVSPGLTGIPTAPTAAPGTNTTQIATTAFATQSPTIQGAINAQTAVTTTPHLIITDSSGTQATVFGSGWAANTIGVQGALFVLGPDGWITLSMDVVSTSASPSKTLCNIPSAAYAPNTAIAGAGFLFEVTAASNGGGGNTSPLVQPVYMVSANSGATPNIGLPEIPSFQSGVRMAGMARYPGPNINLEP